VDYIYLFIYLIIQRWTTYLSDFAAACDTRVISNDRVGLCTRSCQAAKDIILPHTDSHCTMYDHDKHDSEYQISYYYLVQSKKNMHWFKL
jgi:hypothetical protein